jgi:hypothetical protein
VLTSDEIIDHAPTVWSIARTADEKQQIIKVFEMALTDVAARGASYAELTRMSLFVTKLATDGALEFNTVSHMVDQARAAMPDWSDMIALHDHAQLDIVRAILDGQELPAIFDLVEQLVSYSTANLFRPQLRDALLADVVALYTGHAPERAVAVLAHITNTSVWRSALEKYIIQGGDIDMAVHAEELERLFGTLATASRRDTPSWDLRADVTAFLSAMNTADYAAARTSLLHLAERAASPKVDQLDDATLLQYAQRLLAVHPASVSAGKMLFEYMNQSDTHFSRRKELYELFISYGATEVRDAYRVLVQEQQESDRALYLRHYAGGALAVAAARQRR